MLQNEDAVVFRGVINLLDPECARRASLPRAQGRWGREEEEEEQRKEEEGCLHL